jgi:hypothetical protein
MAPLLFEGLQQLPRAVERVLAFKSCRRAIKFGDELDSLRIRLLVEQLAQVQR